MLIQHGVPWALPKVRQKPRGAGKGAILEAGLVQLAGGRFRFLGAGSVRPEGPRGASPHVM